MFLTSGPIVKRTDFLDQSVKWVFNHFVFSKQLFSLEVVSKPQIRFKGKAQADR